MARIISLPNEIDQNLSLLTELNSEVTGFLFYEPFNLEGHEYCPVEDSFITGVGNSGSVEPERVKIQILNEFLRQNPNYRLIRFHTHSKRTLEQFGDYYANHFSELDQESTRKEIIKNPDHIDILYTPNGKYFASADIDDLKIQYTQGSSCYPEGKSRIETSLKEIARNLGHNLENFVCT